MILSNLQSILLSSSLSCLSLGRKENTPVGRLVRRLLWMFLMQVISNCQKPSQATYNTNTIQPDLTLVEFKILYHPPPFKPTKLNSCHQDLLVVSIDQILITKNNTNEVQENSPCYNHCNQRVSQKRLDLSFA